MRFLILFMFATSAFAQTNRFDLDMSVAEYERILKPKMIRGKYSLIGQEPELDGVLQYGKRLIDWVKIINQGRSKENRLLLSSSESYTPAPVERPLRFSPAIIVAQLSQTRKNVPSEMENILASDSELSDHNPISDEAFNANARVIYRIYQFALRWLLLLPSLDTYANKIRFDISGYYFLNKDSEWQKNLTNWASLSSNQQGKYRTYLLSLCRNDLRLYKEKCLELLQQSENANDLIDFVNTFWSNSKKVYDRYFNMIFQRKDITWTSANSDLAVMPFLTPSNNKIKDWLAFNIEDEWKFKNWRLKLEFKDDGHPDQSFPPYKSNVIHNLKQVAENTYSFKFVVPSDIKSGSYRLEFFNRFDRLDNFESAIGNDGNEKQVAKNAPLVVTSETFPKVDQDIQAYRAVIKEKQNTFEQKPGNPKDKEWVKAKLEFMFEIDQYTRSYMNWPKEKKYSEEETKYFWSIFGPTWMDLDFRDTEELKILIVIWDWFKISEFSAQADRQAWLIVQHADHDPIFQKLILTKLEKLYPVGETSPMNYAYLFDRDL